MPDPEAASAQAHSSQIRLAEDGSGDVPDLASALLAAPPGTAILLGPGTYTLAHSITVTNAVTLIGPGADQTEVVADTPGHLVHFLGEGPFALDGITFRQTGSEAADVVVMDGGQVHVSACRFTGGVWRDGELLGNGLVLSGTTSGLVEDSEAWANGLHGMLVNDAAQPTLAGNKTHYNEGSGIVYLGLSGRDRRGESLTENGANGFYIDNDATPKLIRNTSLDNLDTGIAYLGDAGGEATDNRCMGNATMASMSPTTQRLC